MILISQAYVLRKIWGVGKANKSHLKSLSTSWKFHLFIKNNLKLFLKKQGLLSSFELSNFSEKNWNEWIKQFDRYSLYPKVWHSIAPNKWRVKVSEHWKKNQFFDFNIGEKKLVFSEQTDHRSLSCIEFLVEKTKKTNKLLKQSLLTYNFLDPNRNLKIKNIYQLNEKSEHNNIILSEIRKYPPISKKNRIFIDFPMNDKNIFFQYNLFLWFVPEFAEQKNKNKKVLNLNIAIMGHRNLDIFRNKEILSEKEVNQSIRQWRWRSRNYEKRFRTLGNMASLMTFMQNQETMVSLSGKMRKDLELFRLFFRRNNNFNRLAINSEHRLPRLLNDQILIYKLITTSLKFKQRLKRILNLQNIDEYCLTTTMVGNNQNPLSLSTSFDLEYILLPKRRREFRILNSLAFQQEKNKEPSTTVLRKGRKQDQKIILDKNQIIKRFIWSSYRFEDLACMNRFWFSTINGSRFCMLRFRMYPRI